MDVDRAIELIARRQYGVFTRDQAVRAGATPASVKHRLTTGAWVRLENAVYGLPSHRGTWHRQLRAATLGTPGSAVGGLAAAALHELPGFRPVRPEIVVPPGTNSRSRLATVHRYDGVRTTRVNGIPVTTIAQTVFDIARRVSVSQLERAIDDPLLTGRIELGQLVERRDAYAGTRRAGLPLLHALIAERSDDAWQPPESELEAALWPLVLAVPDMPGAVRQVTLPWRGPKRARWDVLIPDWATIVEADGRRWHARVQAFDEDRWRDNEAQANGYRVLRFTHVHITHRPTEVIDLIARVGRVAAGRAA